MTGYRRFYLSLTSCLCAGFNHTVHSEHWLLRCWILKSTVGF